MEISRRGFPERNSDNDEVYLYHFCGVVESIDELSSLEITKTPHSYHFRIAPSLPKYINPLIKEITKFSNLFGVRLEMSKSMKASSTVTFDIEINNN